jgi:hypothetical protein
VTQNLAVVAVPTLPDPDLALVLAQDPDPTVLTENIRRSTPNPEMIAEVLQRTEIIKRRAEREAPAQAKEAAKAAVEAAPEAAEARALAVTKEVADPVLAKAEKITEKKMEKERKMLILNKL